LKPPSSVYVDAIFFSQTTGEISMGHKPPTLDQEFSIQQKSPMGKLAFFFKFDMFAIFWE